MATLKKYNLKGEETGTVDVDVALSEKTVHSQMVKDYIVALRANARQWSASTKGRSEVKHTTKKPHRQKGTGRARQGSLVAPQYRGGGVVFGPKPKFEQNIQMNRKERKAVVHALIAEKINAGQLVILEDSGLDVPKTKIVVNFLKNAGLGKRVLFIGEGKYTDVETNDKKQRVSVKNNQHVNLAKSLNNLSRASFSLAKNVNGYRLMHADGLVVTQTALDELREWLV